MWNKINLRKAALRSPPAPGPGVGPPSSITSSTRAKVPGTLQHHQAEHPARGQTLAGAGGGGEEASTAVSLCPGGRIPLQPPEPYSEGVSAPSLPVRRALVPARGALLEGCRAFHANNSHSLRLAQVAGQPLLLRQPIAGHRSQIGCRFGAAKRTVNDSKGPVSSLILSHGNCLRSPWGRGQAGFGCRSWQSRPRVHKPVATSASSPFRSGVAALQSSALTARLSVL